MSDAPAHRLLPPRATSATAADLRRRILEQSHRAHVGHIGSSLSIADIIDVLYADVLRGRGGDDPHRDTFILSKGHAALAVYCAMAMHGLLDPAALDSYCGDDSLLGVHPEHHLGGIDFSTGSLGHGLSLGAGVALANRMREQRGRVFVLMSDAELNEGSVWEAAMLAGQHRLGNLVAIVDLNGQQALAPTREVIDIGSPGPAWDRLGWEAIEVDGHDPVALLDVLKEQGERPRLVAARTVCGRGVSFMERRVEWHYLPMSDEQFQLALDEVGRSQ